MRRMFNFAIITWSACVLLADDWPQWLGPRRDAVWRETGIVEKFGDKGPETRWRTPIGAGYSGPAVAKGRVYITDRQLKQGATNPADPFQRGKIAGTERVLCLDEATGKIIWQHEYDCPYTVSYPAGPRTTPLVEEGRVYTLGSEGNLLCLDAKKGQVLWEVDFNERYGIPTPLWGFSSHPLIDGEKLICIAGGNGTTVVALDKKSGKQIWSALSAKEPGYSPPMIFELAGKRQLIVWHPESVNGLNPENGEVLWNEPFEVQAALTAPTPRLWKDHLFLTAFYDGGRMYKFNKESPGATLVWRSTKRSEKDTQTLHSIISTPFIEGDHIYGVCSYGQLRCLKAETGERLWETLSATTPDGKPARWANAFLIKNGERYLVWNEKGDLILANLSPEGYQEISRAHLLEPTNTAAGRDVLWSHPAFANGHMYARNDKEIISVNLRK